MMADTPTWIDAMGSFAAVASAAFVLAGGLWAYFRFRKDAPYIARANLTVEAELLTHEDRDLVRVKCTASAIGRGRFIFDKKAAPPNVAVYPMTPALLEVAPEEWTNVRVAIEAFRADELVEAGEILSEVALIWIGSREPHTVAYRVAASFTACDKPGGDLYIWQAVAVVPVEAQLHSPRPSGENATHGAESST
jgi:hypothetical protein